MRDGENEGQDFSLYSGNRLCYKQVSNEERGYAS